VIKHRTRRRRKGAAVAKSRTPKGTRARTKVRPPRVRSTAVRRRQAVRESSRRHPLTTVKVRRRRRGPDTAVIDALFRLAAALGYRVELRALRRKQRARRV
jgi:hypothetical protein